MEEGDEETLSPTKRRNDLSREINTKSERPRTGKERGKALQKNKEKGSNN